MEVVKRLLSDFADDDMLIEGFRNNLFGQGFVFNGDSIKYDNYSKLKHILTATDRTSQISDLIYYVNNEWYSAQSDSAWHDSRLKDSDTYYGYWCFEGAALAVALTIDISKFSDIEFIPYDLLKSWRQMPAL